MGTSEDLEEEGVGEDSRQKEEEAKEEGAVITASLGWYATTAIKLGIIQGIAQIWPMEEW